ncbi:MAG: DUF6932 family protein [Planctomycetota bacterium]|jgi:hypothetical protein
MKRRDAFRKVRTVCERLDEADPDTFFVRPFKLYLFGSVLTDKPDPNDVDLVLVHREHPVQSREEAQERYSDIVYGRPLPFHKASTYLRRGMKMIRLYPADDEIGRWDQLHIFSDARDLRLIWKPGLNWRALVGDIEAHPHPWSEPRAPDAGQRADDAWDALSAEEQHAKIARIVDALDEQEKELERSFSDG